MNLDIYAEKAAPRGKSKPRATSKALAAKKPFDSMTARELAALPREEYIANLPHWARDAMRQAWAANDRARNRKR